MLHRRGCLHDMFSSSPAENLQDFIFTHFGNASCQPEDGSGLPRRAETFGGYDSSSSVSSKSKKGNIQHFSDVFTGITIQIIRTRNWGSRIRKLHQALKRKIRANLQCVGSFAPDTNTREQSRALRDMLRALLYSFFIIITVPHRTLILLKKISLTWKPRKFEFSCLLSLCHELFFPLCSYTVTRGLLNP